MSVIEPLLTPFLVPQLVELFGHVLDYGGDEGGGLDFVTRGCAHFPG